MPKKIQKAERSAIYSSCCGVTGEITLTDSAVIILFAGMIGAGNLLSLLTTAILPFCNGLLLLPFACFAGRIGIRPLMYLCCILATGGYLLAGCSPFFEGSNSIRVLFAGLLIFSFSIPGFIAGWFPLLDTFLSQEKRPAFLGKMRFFHQLSAVLFLFFVSFCMGKEPRIETLQSILFLGAILFSGRIFFLTRIPFFPQETNRDFPWRKGIPTAIQNRPLTRFSLYQFFLNLCIFGNQPLAILYLKNELNVEDNTIIAVSAASLAGMLLGYLSAAKMTRIFALDRTFRILHLVAIAICIGLFFLKGRNNIELIFFTLFLSGMNFTISAASVVASAKMMTLATQGNKTIAMAYCGAFYYLGGGLSRLLIPLLLGMGLDLFGTGEYRSIFLLTGIAGTILYLLYGTRPARTKKQAIV